MRVVQILPDMQLGGVERGVVELSRSIVRQGMDSFVISRYGDLVEQLKCDDASHIQFDCGSKNILTLYSRAKKLRKILNDIQPDIVHVRSRIPAWLLRFSHGSKRRFRVISTLHGLYTPNFYSRQMAMADTVICPSRSVIDYAKKYYDVPIERLRLIYRGIDFDYFDLQKIDATIRQNFIDTHGLEKATVIAIVGRLSRIKGHELFFRAFAHAKRRDDSLLALVIGDAGDNTKRLQRFKLLLEELGISHAVRFAGVCRQMREIYSAVDAVVSSSTKPEAFGRTMAEALAMGCPVIAAKHGGALDIVRDGENGLLFAVNDEHELASSLLKLSTIRRENLRESVLHFSLSRMSEQTIAVYTGNDK